MATVSVAKIKIRRGSDFDRRQIILDNGELGYVTDSVSRRLFVGDGIYLHFFNDAWEFYATSDSGNFQRAYYPWSDSTIIPNTTGWLQGAYGFGIQENYNYMVITKI